MEVVCILATLTGSCFHCLKMNITFTDVFIHCSLINKHSLGVNNPRYQIEKTEHVLLLQEAGWQPKICW